MSLSPKPWLCRAVLRDPDTIDFTRYPWNIPAVRHLDSLRFHADVTFLVGENGSGKSTVLEALALAMGFSPEGGTPNARFQTTAAAVSPLHRDLRLSRSFGKLEDGFFLRAESYYNLATYQDEIGLPYGGQSLHEMSHGESFLFLLTRKFRGHGLYFLDEPEAALSPTRQLAALAAIHQLVRKGSQFIIATHSPILMAYPDSNIFQFDETGISPVTYEETESYAVTRDFLNHHPARIQRLLRGDES